MKKAITYIAAILFIIFVCLTILESRGNILNLQVYININLLPLIFWLFVGFLGVRIVMADLGFLKIGGVLNVLVAFVILATQLSYNDIKFESLKSEDYELILSINRSSDNRYVSVYKKVNGIYSEYLDTISVTSQYSMSYEIIDDTFVLHKCTEVTCIEDVVELE